VRAGYHCLSIYCLYVPRRARVKRQQWGKENENDKHDLMDQLEHLEWNSSGVTGTISRLDGDYRSGEPEVVPIWEDTA
jgi:hypothetical protein